MARLHRGEQAADWRPRLSITRTSLLPLAFLVASLGGCAASSPPLADGMVAPDHARPRVVVTTDPELDDSNSLVRYLLYSTDFQTEGLIYASSQFHWKGDGKGTKWFVPNREYRRFGLNLCPCESWRWAPDERFIDDALKIYEKVYPNLKVHDPDYPTPDELKSKIFWGNVEFDGDIAKETPGSRRIEELLLDDVPGPIYLLAWGGQSTIARALKSIQERYQDTPDWPAVYQKVSRKAILSTSGDQDDTGATYIRPNWPEIRTLPAGGGGVPLGYGARNGVRGKDTIYYGTEWMRENVSSKGPLGAFVRVWGDGKQMVKGDVMDYFGIAGHTAQELKAMGYAVWLPPRPKGEFLGEGDTFTYLNLVDNGLLGYRDGTLGGWAGLGARPGARPSPSGPDFIDAAQNDLAARMKWSVTPTYAAANHEPRVTIRGPTHITARPGETVLLRGAVSDPDGDRLSAEWWQWQEAGSYPGDVQVSGSTALDASVRLPADARAGQTIHLILEATDDGTPALTRYGRVVVTVAE
jgi:hypothetical protein